MDHDQEVLWAPTVIPDFGLDLSFDAIQARFIGAARSILLEHKLVRANYRWDVNSLELYLYRSHIWPDKTTHCTCQQLKHGFWYVHRDGKLPPKRLGIDITAGCGDRRIYAGMLLAAIGERSGSGRAVKAIVRGNLNDPHWIYQDAEKRLLQDEINNQSIRSSSPHLRLVRRDEPRRGPLWIGPRKLSSKVCEPYRSCHLRIQHDELPRSMSWNGRCL